MQHGFGAVIAVRIISVICPLSMKNTSSIIVAGAAALRTSTQYHGGKGKMLRLYGVGVARHAGGTGYRYSASARGGISVKIGSNFQRSSRICGPQRTMDSTISYHRQVVRFDARWVGWLNQS